MKYLITGGAGFIGSHLAEALLAQRHQVWVIDDLSTGSLNNIRHLKSNPDFHCTVGNILNERLLAKLISQVDVVLHLAAAVGVRLIIEKPVRTIETNISGTEAVLKLACLRPKDRQAARRKKLVLVASSSEVYGKNSKVPFSEDDDMLLGATVKSRWSYACSKAIDEFLALAYWREKKQPVIIARLFNTVGPRQTGRYGMVIPRFVRQALRGEPITVYGTGKQSRCFTDVSDVVAALIKLSQTKKARGQVFNIGANREITIDQLAKKVKARTKSPSPIKHIPYDQAYQEGFEDMLRRVPDLAKIKRFINYKPTKNIDQILDRVIEHEQAGMKYY